MSKKPLRYEPDNPRAYKNGYVNLAREYAERMLGRTLLKTEVVAFRDGDRQNLEKENLIVLKTSGDMRRFYSSLRNVGLLRMSNGAYTYDRSVGMSKAAPGQFSFTTITVDDVVKVMGDDPRPTIASLARTMNLCPSTVSRIFENKGLKIQNINKQRAELVKFVKALDENGGNGRTASHTALHPYSNFMLKVNKYGVSRNTVKRSASCPRDLFGVALMLFGRNDVANMLNASQQSVEDLIRVYGLGRRRPMAMANLKKYPKRVIDVVARANQCGVPINVLFNALNGTMSEWVVRRMCVDTDNFILQNVMINVNSHAIKAIRDMIADHANVNSATFDEVVANNGYVKPVKRSLGDNQPKDYLKACVDVINQHTPETVEKLKFTDECVQIVDKVCVNYGIPNIAGKVNEPQSTDEPQQTSLLTEEPVNDRLPVVELRDVPVDGNQLKSYDTRVVSEGRQSGATRADVRKLVKKFGKRWTARVLGLTEVQLAEVVTPRNIIVEVELIRKFLTGDAIDAALRAGSSARQLAAIFKTNPTAMRYVVFTHLRRKNSQ